MKKTYLAALALILCFASCKEETKMETETSVLTDSMAVDTTSMEESISEMPIDSATMQKEWEKYMTPGKVHEMLAAEEGTWSNEMTFWMGADAEPQKATSTADIKMIMGGRYQQINYTGDMMGMPFEGMATVAYNNETGEIISTWIDNMGTGMMVLRGEYDGEGNTITTSGSMIDPVTGKECKVREVYTIVDENTRKMEMFEVRGEGEEYKSMEIVMKRK